MTAQCAWLAGCDEPPVYVGFYGPCDNAECTADECRGAMLCERHAAVERSNPTLIRLTALVAS